MTDLDSFIKEADSKSKFLRFTDGEPITGIYREAKLVQDNFNPEAQTIEYTLEIEGRTKTFNSRSVRLARQLNAISKGATVTIARTGTGMKTDWSVIPEK